MVREMTLGQLIVASVRERQAVDYKNEILRRLIHDPTIPEVIDRAYYAQPEQPQQEEVVMLTVPNGRRLRPEDDLQAWLSMVKRAGYDSGTGMRDPEKAREDVELAMYRGETWDRLPDAAKRFYAKMEQEFDRWMMRQRNV